MSKRNSYVFPNSAKISYRPRSEKYCLLSEIRWQKYKTRNGMLVSSQVPTPVGWEWMPRTLSETNVEAKPSLVRKDALVH